MIAVKKSNLYAMRHLLGKGAKKNIVDKKGNNVYHYMAYSTPEIIQVTTSGEI